MPRTSPPTKTSTEKSSTDNHRSLSIARGGPVVTAKTPGSGRKDQHPLRPLPALPGGISLCSRPEQPLSPPAVFGKMAPPAGRMKCASMCNSLKIKEKSGKMFAVLREIRTFALRKSSKYRVTALFLMALPRLAITFRPAKITAVCGLRIENVT